MSSAKALRFSDAAYAIGKAPSTLRNWLQRNQVKLPGQHSEGWREFTYADIAVLAIVAKLVSFGLKVETASAVAEELFRAYPDVFNCIIPNPETVEAMWNNRVLKLWPEGDSLELRVVDLWQVTRERHLDSSGELVTASILLDVGKILRVAFSRAIESNSDGATT